MSRSYWEGLGLGRVGLWLNQGMHNVDSPAEKHKIFVIMNRFLHQIGKECTVGLGS
jgi:hypothetical protein